MLYKYSIRYSIMSYCCLLPAAVAAQSARMACEQIKETIYGTPLVGVSMVIALPGRMHSKSNMLERALVHPLCYHLNEDIFRGITKSSSILRAWGPPLKENMDTLLSWASLMKDHMVIMSTRPQHAHDKEICWASMLWLLGFCILQSTV